MEAVALSLGGAWAPPLLCTSITRGPASWRLGALAWWLSWGPVGGNTCSHTPACAPWEAFFLHVLRLLLERE